MTSPKTLLMSAPTPAQDGEFELASASVRPEPSTATAVAIKPLEWKVSTWKGTVVFKAQSICGEYLVAPKVFGSGWLWRIDTQWDDTYSSADDDEEAKAAAQADYESRIRSALENQPVALADATQNKGPSHV